MHQHQPIIAGTVDDLISRYLASNYFTGQLAVNSQIAYRKCLSLAKTVLVGNSSFGSMQLDLIKYRHVDEFYSGLLKISTKSMSVLTCRVLRRVFQLGFRWEMLSFNPFYRMELPSMESRDRTWSSTEIDAFCNTAIALGKGTMAKVLRLAHDTGQRPSDLLSIMGKQYRDGTLTITQIKTEAVVYLTVTNELQGMLQVGPDELVFDGLTYKTMNRDFVMIRRAAGLPEDLQFRDMRRTVATEIADNGGTEDEIMAVTGHTSRQVVSVYVKKGKARAASALEKMRKGRASYENSQRSI